MASRQRQVYTRLPLLEDKQAEFIEYWRKNMTVDNAEGFYREILTRPVQKPDPKFNTFSITERNYATYINIGIWETIGHFEKAITKFFPKASEEMDASGKRTQTIELAEFEFKIRERIVLERTADRGDQLPPSSLR